MTRLLRIAAFVCAAALSAAASAGEGADAARTLLSFQRDAWNRADLDGFMQGYWRSDDLRFAGGDSFRNGWQATLDRYRKVYPDAAAMGRLDFDVVEARELAPDVVYLFGKWSLALADRPGPHGVFTLIVERKDGRWVITRDHSSATGQ